MVQGETEERNGRGAGRVGGVKINQSEKQITRGKGARTGKRGGEDNKSSSKKSHNIARPGGG